MKSSLYHKITTQFVPDVLPVLEKDATLAQIEIDWKKHPHTIKFYKETVEEIDNLIDAAISQACSYPQHNNHQQIIEKLVRAEQLRKVLEKYA